MTHRLPDACEKVTWRLRSADMELLRLLFPNKVNDVVRDLLTQYCDHIREAGLSARRDQQSTPPNTPT